MKNIHVLATEKPSRLAYLSKKGKEVFKDLRLFDRLMPIILDSENQHIYITSDEEIKEGDWLLIIDDFETYVHEHKGDNLPSTYCKKIILTTDQDLIKDGVQSIDDDFLEWFVQNPSCEDVEVVDNLKYFNVDELRERHLKGLPHLYSEKIGYKIIIPKEEPKPIHQQIIDAVGGEDKFREIAKIKPKKQSLEEIAESWFNKDEFYPDPKQGFIEGYKLAQDNSNINALNFEINALKRLVKVLEHQQERMYSEEEVRKIAEEVRWQAIGDPLEFTKNFDEWFEQFKKK